MRTILIKLGGSVLTGKKTRGAPRLRVEDTARLGREILAACRAAQIRPVVIHGGGSFGHPEARRLRVPAFPTPPQPAAQRRRRAVAVSRLQSRMQDLSHQVQDALAQAGLATQILPGSLAVRIRQGRIAGLHTRLIDRVLGLDATPLLYGDAAHDAASGGGIVSGDVLTRLLARRLEPQRVLFVTDVDGLFDPDASKKHPAESLDPGQARGLVLPDGGDATGGIAAKARAAATIASRGVPVVLVNGLARGRLAKAIRGQKVVSTRIAPP